MGNNKITKKALYYTPVTIKSAYKIATLQKIDSVAAIQVEFVDDLHEIKEKTKSAKFLDVMIKKLYALDNIDYLPVSFGASFILEDV